jgi:carboxypeptidase family protein/TonB-dependent receptor-like protein
VSTLRTIPKLLAGLGLLLVGLVSPAQAQQFNGTLRGVINDSTGAVLPGASVSVTDVATNDTRNVTTDARGSWVLPNLKPGTYRIVVTMDGFKTAALDNVKLDVQGIRDVELQLEVGAAAETVTVSGQAAAVEVTSSTISQTIENKRMVDLPLNGRNPFALAGLAPGVAPTSNNGGSSPSISGGRNATSEVAIDGVSNVNAENNVSILDLNYTPSVDAVQEFSVQTNAVSAEFGRLGGGVINLITKSGSNALRFTAWEFARNAKMDATNFFTNRNNGKKPSFKRNQFGGNVGGPIHKDKTFFFANYEGLRQESASVQTFTVPLPEWRNGDFSNFRNAQGQLITIYDPLTTRADPANPGQFIRDPFPENKIPQNRISPMARAMMAYWPLPNTSPSNQFTQNGNFSASGVGVSNADRIDSRVDHVFSDRWRTFVRYSFSDEEGLPFNSFGNAASSAGGDGPTFTRTHSLSIDNNYTLGPSWVLNVRYGLNRRLVDRLPISAGFDLGSIGFPANVIDTADAFEFPRVNVQNFQSLGQATFTDLLIAPTTHSLNANATKVWGAHTIKMGADYRKFFLNFTQLFFPSGQISFNNAQWTQRNPNVTSGTQGAALASMLLGIPSGFNLSHNPDPASASSYFGGYVQDDWKLGRNFTVNLGLRYEFDVPRTERFNRLAYFDENAVSPIAGQVAANPYFDPSQLRGAVVFMDDSNRQQVDTDYDNISPRVGFAWNFADKTVVRGGYGIFYMPSHVQAAGHSGSSGMIGYNTQSDMIVSLDSNRTPFRYIDNPFPDGFNLPPGNSLGAATNIGLGMGGGTGGVFTTNQVPHMQQWNLNVQRELPWNVITEVAYIGSRGTDLLIGESGLQFGQVDPSFLGLGTGLQEQVANPFFGVITNPSSPLRFQTVSRNRLLRPFPQYDGVSAFRVPGAKSIYHAITARADKRFANGLSLLVSYTYGQLKDDASTTVGFLGQAGTQQNAYDRAGDYSISSNDVKYRWVTAFVYDLPFGKDQHWASNAGGVTGALISGWQVNGILTFQSGYPLIVTQGSNNVNLFNPTQRPTWTGNDATLGDLERGEAILQWFDRSQFSVTPAFQFGNTPRVMPDIRSDGIKNLDFSLFKNNRFNDGKWNAQIRIEAFNVLNRTQFNFPNTQVDSSAFGTITGAGGARQLQIGLKLMF